jgi:hypothetical protein
VVGDLLFVGINSVNGFRRVSDQLQSLIQNEVVCDWRRSLRRADHRPGRAGNRCRRNKGTNGFMLTLDIDADTAPPKAKATGM